MSAPFAYDLLLETLRDIEALAIPPSQMPAAQELLASIGADLDEAFQRQDRELFEGLLGTLRGEMGMLALESTC
jgi:hypothetical protein